MRKIRRKLLALVLSVTIILSCIPMTTFAIGSTTDNIDNIIVNNQTQEATIVTEVTEKRDADKKVYLLSDGSYMSAIYSQQVHYEENGKWEDIDNSFASGVDDDGESTVENSKNAFKIKFANKAKDKKLVSLKKDGYEINWALNDSENVSAETIVSDNALNTPSSLKNINSAVVYKDILTDTDLKYTINSTTIKEDIILNSINAPTTFTFNYETKKLAYRETEDGSIEVYSDNEPNKAVFVIDKPYMYDANGISSDSVEMQISETKKGFQIVIIPNAEWIKSDERKFPITIDPTIITEQSASSIKDTTGVYYPKTDQLYNALEANSNYLWLKVGKFYGTEAYSLVYVPLPSDISESCRILDAKMNLICYRAGISTASSNLTITAHEITTDWNQNTISENKILYLSEIPDYDYVPADFMILNDSSSSVHNQLYSFDITKIAQKWATGESVNRGILLAGQDLPSTERYIRFYDSDNSVRNSDPCFTYTYRDTKGVEDYWTYTSLTAGRSGTAAANNYNGNLVVTQNITGISGNRMPVSISAIYDSSSRSNNHYNLGNGWRTNYNMKICTSNLEGYPYYLIDADGTEHYFYGETSASEWKDEDGLGFTLKCDSTVNSNGYLITDKSKGKMYFRSDGNLSRVDDTFGNTIEITYNSASKISTIKDGAGRNYNFAYNSSGLLSSVTNPANKVVSFSYTSNNLTSINYPDGKNTTFVYGNYGLERINSPDGTYTMIGYTHSGNHLYTTTLEYYGSNNVLNTDYDLEYQHNATTVTSNCDNTLNHTYQFDNYGRTVGVINNNVYAAEYYNYGAPGGNATGTENKLLSASKTIQSTFTYYNDNDSYSNSSKWYVEPYATDTTISIDNTRGRNDAPSLKVTQTNEYGGYSAVIFDAGVLKGGYDYNFSAFINTNGVTIDASYGISVDVYYYNSEYDYNEYGFTGGTVLSTFEDDWIYSNSQLGLNEDQHCYVVIGCYMESPGSFWVDDLQIQLGDGSSDYNYIEDNVFFDGAKNWVYKRNNSVSTDDSLTFYTGSTCTFDGAYNEKRSVSQETNCKGKAGDTLIFGTRAVAYSVPTNVTRTGAAGQSTFRARIELKGPSGTATFSSGENILDFNPYLDEWQFMSKALIAPIDFTSVTFYFEYDYNVYFAMFTKPFIYKESFGQSYTYDSNGNVVSTVDLAETEATFAYQNNNLSQMINPTGSRYSYAYNETTNALEYANSSDGQLFAFTYDQYGNVLSSTITAKRNATQLENDSTYYIRNLTTGNAMKNANSKLVNGTYAAQNNTIRWNLISAGETDVYYIQPAGDTTKYLTVKDASTSDKAEITVSEISNSDSQKFKITSNNDGTFSILTKVSNYTKAIDGRDLNDNGSTELNKSMVQYTKDSNSGNQKWSFEKYIVNNPDQEKITSYATYTSDGNYVSTETDVFGDITSYQYNNDGTVHSVTDAKNNTTTYSYYDNTSNLKSVTSGNSTNTYTYENDQLKTIETANGMVYTFIYDAFGRNTSVKLNRKNSTAEPRTLATYKYKSDIENQNAYGGQNNLYEVVYGNGHTNFIEYNSRGLTSLNCGTAYSYNRNGNVIMKDSNMELRTHYNYDLSGRVVNKSLLNMFNYYMTGSLSYKYVDQKNLLDSYRFSNSAKDLTTSFIYGNINKGEIPETVYGVKLNGVLKLGYNYDDFARLSNRTLYTVNSSVVTNYSYKAPTTDTTSYLVDTVTENGFTYNYTYDAVGNITAYTKTNTATNQVVESYIYQYDDKNQLTFAGTSTQNGTRYTYDAGGNILAKTDTSTGTTVNYGYTDPTWTDLLTSYNGQAITYDEIGNPLSYLNGMTMTWVEGRRLSSIVKNGMDYTYNYDSEGNRTSKFKGPVITDEWDGETPVTGITTTDFTVIDGVMYGEERVDWDTGETITIYYLYDDNEKLYGFELNGVNYYYQYNLQGDVIGIYNTDGQLVVEYKYDAWGKVLSVSGSLASTVGQINPIRYRGYYYDVETGFYYLQSRYYDPEIGRFINADNVISASGDSVAGYNMFAYCFNNPINMIDENGNWPKWLEKAAVVVSAVVVVAAVVVTVAAVTAYTAGTGTAAAVYGASILLGASLSGINGAVANASKGNSYFNGYWGGFVSGATQSFCSKYPGGTVWGGTIGTGAGTAITDVLNNLDPDSSNSSGSEIIQNVSVSAAKATITSMQTALIGSGVGGINYSTGELVGGVADQCGGLMPGLTLGFGEGIKAFFGAVDDAMVYIWN